MSIIQEPWSILYVDGAGPRGDKGDTGSAGVIQEVIAGTNVTVDNTDPARPIISATGGGGGGTGAVDSVNGQTGIVVLTKSSLGLSNVDNTSDANKPISNAAQTALDAKQNTLVSAANIKTINGSSILGSGDLVISGGGGTGGAVDSVNGKTGVVVLTKSDVGLANADNTSDVNKPISAATQTALNAKQDTLVSATSIKTINGNSVLGSGDLVISSPVQSVTGTAVTGTSTNPVVNLPTADQVTETASKVFVSPAEKAAITHSNRSTLDLITEAFTTALKSTYDAAVAWVATNGSNVLAHLSRTDNPHSVTKSQVGLSNVDNTTDLLKPISTATQTALNAKQDTIVNSDSITQGSTNLFLSASERAKLVNTSGTNSGDNATNTTSNTYADSKVADAIVDGVTTVAPSQNAVFDALAAKENTIVSGTTTQYFRGDKTFQTLDKSAVGLSSVDNTSDVNKPVSAATQTALNAKADLVGGLIPSSQLPSYVDDVVEVADFAALPITGEVGKIYVLLDNGELYRWTGSLYIEISQGVTLHNQLTLNDGTNPHGTTKADVGLSNVDNTSDLNKPISNATQTALNTKQDTLVSATNIKTINGNSVLGSGDLVIGSDVNTVTLTGVQTLTNKTISGASNTITVDGTNSVGFRNIPQVSQSTAYTLVLDDSGKHILHPSADTTARTFTIPANSSVAFPIGTAITFVNQNAAGVVTIAITTDTMRLAGTGTTGSRTLTANGVATAIKITTTEWLISGTGLT